MTEDWLQIYQEAIELKKHIVPEDIIELSEGEKDSLKKLWLPEQFELFTVPACKDAENDLYDYDIYVIQEVNVNSINEDKKYDFSYHPVHAYNYHEVLLKSIPLKQTDNSHVPFCHEEEDMDESFEGYEEIDERQEIIESSPTYFIHKNNALPLLSIGKMIQILYKKKCRDDMRMQLNVDMKTCIIDEVYFESDCLCDSLWKAVKTLL